MKGKGQITIFAVLGLVIIIIVSVAMYVAFQEETGEPGEEVVQQHDSVINPIVQEVEACMYDLSKEVFEDLGETGGFLDVNEDRYRMDMEQAYLNNALELFEGTGLVLPYWYGIRGDPNCQDCEIYTQRPSLEGDHGRAIQFQAENYIGDNLADCTDFSGLEERFDVEILNEPSIEVLFLDRSTEVVADWDLEIEVFEQDRIISHSYFSEEIDLPLKGIYRVASDLLYQGILQQGILDDYTVEMTDVLASGGRDGPVPPRSGGVSYELEAPDMWMLSDVEEEVQSFLSENLNYIQVQDSFGHQILTGQEDSFTSSIIAGLFTDINTDDEIRNTRIRFHHLPSWPMYVNVNPSTGDLIMPESEDDLPSIPFLSLSITYYYFDYDASYPVLVTLDHQDAFGGEGYNFQFVAEANMRLSDTYDSEVVQPEDDEEQETGFGDVFQRNIPVSLQVEDANGLPVEGVSVSYTCRDERVMLGETGDDGVVESELANCINGFFDVEGLDYYADRKNTNIVGGGDNSYNLVVYEEQEVRVNPVKRFLVINQRENEDDEDSYGLNTTMSGSQTFGGGKNNFRGLDGTENMTVIFERVEDGESTDFIRTLEIREGQSQDDRFVELVPGEYRIMANSILNLEDEFHTVNETIEIPDETPWWWPSEEPDDVEIEGQNLNDTLAFGFVEFDESNELVEITPEDIEEGVMDLTYLGYDLNNVIVTPIRARDGERELMYTRDLEILAEIYDPSDEYLEEIRPEFG